MAERVIALGDITEHLPNDPWIVVFGGVTREGNRRARPLTAEERFRSDG